MRKLIGVSAVIVAVVAWGQVFRPNGFTSAPAALTYSTAHSAIFDAGLLCDDTTTAADLLAAPECQARLVSVGADSERSNVFTVAEDQTGTGHRLVSAWAELAYFQADGGSTTNQGAPIFMCWFWRPYANGDAGSGSPWALVSNGYNAFGVNSGAVTGQNTHLSMMQLSPGWSVPLPPGYHCFVPAMNSDSDAGKIGMRINRLYQPFTVSK